MSANSPRDEGQAAIEVALTLPFLVLWLVVMVHIALLCRDRLELQSAARDAARAAAVAATNDRNAAALDAAHRGTALAPLDLRLTVADNSVTVTLTHRDRGGIAGWLLPDVDLRASATMPLEPP